MKYEAQEKAWVRKLLARLSPEQRKRYEAECKDAPRHRNGKLYDAAKAKIAERIIYKDRMEKGDERKD